MATDEAALLVSKRNVKYLYELLKTDYNENMSLDVFVQMLKSDKRLHKTFFNKKMAVEAKKTSESIIHPALMYETDEENYIPQYK